MLHRYIKIVPCTIYLGASLPTLFRQRYSGWMRLVFKPEPGRGTGEGVEGEGEGEVEGRSDGGSSSMNAV